MNVWPATLTVPVRDEPLFDGAAVKLTEPLPVPEVVPIVSHSLLLDEAVQAQPGPAVTLIVPEPPLAGTDALVGEIENVHGAASCVTVKV